MHVKTGFRQGFIKRTVYKDVKKGKTISVKNNCKQMNQAFYDDIIGIDIYW